MDLQTFAALSQQIHNPSTRGTIGTKSTKSTTNALMPRQQKTRAYKSIETGRPKIQFQMMRHRTGKMGKKFIIRYIPQLPFGTNRGDVVPQQVKDFAEEYMTSNTNKGDEKYIKIEKANLSWIEYSFDIDKWFNDNFRGKIPRYEIPITLKFKYRYDLPRFIYVNSPFHDLRDFIIERFEKWLESNKRLVKHRKFTFLDNVVPSLFEFKLDVQGQYINASLKYSVILGSLAAYMLFFHNKDIKGKEKDVKRKVQRYSDIKKLDRYVKRL